jgi:cytochrome d ubiquinol oxidase subunit II
MSAELIILTVVMLALTAYAVFGGADFGAGVWEFITAFHGTPKEQRLIDGAMGPVWEANHVWLIFVLIAMFGAFPPAFAALCRALWLPLLLALLGIVARGVGFAFHSYAKGALVQQAVWGRVFAFASTSSPFFLGACIGAIASGRLEVTARGDFTGDYVFGWITPLSIFTAFFAVTVCAFLAAVYLTRDAFRDRDVELINLWRRRALASGAWLLILALLGLAFIAIDAPDLWERFHARSWPFVASALLTGVGTLYFLVSRRFSAAVLAAAATVAALPWGWAFGQYPQIVPPTVTISNARSPDAVLWIMVWSILVACLLVLPSLGLLLYLFKEKPWKR